MIGIYMIIYIYIDANHRNKISRPNTRKIEKKYLKKSFFNIIIK